jgi:hypothetical protein
MSDIARGTGVLGLALRRMLREQNERIAFNVRSEKDAPPCSARKRHEQLCVGDVQGNIRRDRHCNLFQNREIHTIKHVLVTLSRVGRDFLVFAGDPKELQTREGGLVNHCVETHVVRDDVQLLDQGGVGQPLREPRKRV